MNGLIAGMDLLDGMSLGEAAYLLTAFIMAVTVGVGLLTVIARAEARSRVGEAERVAEVRRRLAHQSTPSGVPVEGRQS
jgi:hypothetical protein